MANITISFHNYVNIESVYKNNTGIVRKSKKTVNDENNLKEKEKLEKKRKEEKIKEEVEKLRKRDREVKSHEQAHLAVAGIYARGVHYEYRRGPDGRLYAVGGEVDIDTSPVPNDPQATIRKAQIIQRAALAPVDPSSQDRAVYAMAVQMEIKAQQELLQEQREKTEKKYNENEKKSEFYESSSKKNAIKMKNEDKIYLPFFRRKIKSYWKLLDYERNTDNSYLKNI